MEACAAKLRNDSVWKSLPPNEELATLVFKSMGRVEGGLYDLLIVRFLRSCPLPRKHRGLTVSDPNPSSAGGGGRLAKSMPKTVCSFGWNMARPDFQTLL